MKKLIVLIAASLLCSAPLVSEAFAPKKGDKPCLECHKLNKKEAGEIVGKIVPNGKVLDVKLSPIKGAWQIDVEKDGQRGVVFLDFSKKYLIGQIVSLEAVAKQNAPRKVDASKISLKDAMVLGDKSAAKKVIVFTDPDCPYCRQLHTSMKQIIAKRKDIAFALILNPLPMHKEAYRKSQAILCAQSMDMLDDAFAGKAVPEPPAVCSPDAVERGKAMAQSHEFNGTPTLVRDDGLVLSGFLPEDKLIDWIDKKQ